MINIRLPNITAGTEREQLIQVKSYLHQLAQELNIPHLVLWHTEDQNYSERKTLYMDEGREYYTGDLYVPYDLEVIDLV